MVSLAFEPNYSFQFSPIKNEAEQERFSFKKHRMVESTIRSSIFLLYHLENVILLKAIIKKKRIKRIPFTHFTILAVGGTRFGL